LAQGRRLLDEIVATSEASECYALDAIAAHEMLAGMRAHQPGKIVIKVAT
jgi:hypothetical protein